MFFTLGLERWEALFQFSNAFSNWTRKKVNDSQVFFHASWYLSSTSPHTQKPTFLYHECWLKTYVRFCFVFIGFRHKPWNCKCINFAKKSSRRIKSHMSNPRISRSEMARLLLVSETTLCPLDQPCFFLLSGSFLKTNALRAITSAYVCEIVGWRRYVDPQRKRSWCCIKQIIYKKKIPPTSADSEIICVTHP